MVTYDMWKVSEWEMKEKKGIHIGEVKEMWGDFDDSSAKLEED